AAQATLGIEAVGMRGAGRRQRLCAEQGLGQRFSLCRGKHGKSERERGRRYCNSWESHPSPHDDPTPRAARIIAQDVSTFDVRPSSEEKGMAKKEKGMTQEKACRRAAQPALA